jgi:flagellar protein FlgJ
MTLTTPLPTTLSSAAIEAPAAYFDLQGLSKLKKDAGKTPESLAMVAKQFEGLFMKMILDSARKANEAFGEDNYLNSRETEFYQQMLDNQLSTEMSKGTGLGIAAMLVKQLSPYMKTEPLPIKEKALLPVSPASGHAPSAKAHFSNPDQFVKTLWPQAQQAAQQLGIQPEYLLAQAALETGWGKNVVNNSHNLFGIKADAHWKGERVSAVTTEMHDGKAFNVTAQFRAYPSFEASFNDYVQFIKTQPRYQQAIAVAANPDAYYQQLQTAGYATDPDYARKVIRIAQQDRLSLAVR